MTCYNLNANKRLCIYFSCCFNLVFNREGSSLHMHLHAFIFLHIKKACTHKENLKMSMHGHMAAHRNHCESRAYQLSLFKREKSGTSSGKR